MLRDLYPRSHRRYAALPLLGSVVDDFESWLARKGYTRGIRRQKLKDIVRIERFLRRRAVTHVCRISRSVLGSCRGWYRRRNPSTAGTANSLKAFLDERGLLADGAPPLGPIATHVEAYKAYLGNVRGLSPRSQVHHAYTISRFLAHLDFSRKPECITYLTQRDIEEFLRVSGRYLCRASLQHTAAHLRSYLRFLAVAGTLKAGLEYQIDTPRLYRLERLPRSLPWNVVQRLIQSIDRCTPRGLRDYAMFCLIASYGLRASQVVALTLDDIHWRDRWVHIRERKNGEPLQLPLTDAVASALERYLRQGRPQSPHREVFLRVRAPAGILRPTAVTEAFQCWSRRSGLDIPFHGPHCIRHSYAVHLLRQGMSLKTIGDLLGHRTAESTCVYLRLDIEDLRSVALCIPHSRSRGRQKGARV